MSDTAFAMHPGSATTQSDLWSTRAHDYAELQECHFRPLYEDVLQHPEVAETRRSNRTIDFEHYRTLAEDTRRETSIEIMRNARPAIWMMAACGVLLIGFAVFGQRHSVRQSILQATSATLFTERR